MSLKAFHIFFITLSMLLSLLVGGWGVNRYLTGDSLEGLVLGVFFFLFAVALLVYGLYFLRKVDELGI